MKNSFYSLRSNSFLSRNVIDKLILSVLILISNTIMHGQNTLKPVSPLQIGHYMPGL